LSRRTFNLTTLLNGIQEQGCGSLRYYVMTSFVRDVTVSLPQFLKYGLL
jgi:hypothetical protein